MSGLSDKEQYMQSIQSSPFYAAARYAYKIEQNVTGEHATLLSQSVQKYTALLDNDEQLRNVFVISFVQGAENNEGKLVRSRHNMSRQLRNVFVQENIDDVVDTLRQKPAHVLEENFVSKNHVSSSVDMPAARDKGLPPVFDQKPDLSRQLTSQDMERMAFQASLQGMGAIASMAAQAGKAYAAIIS